MTAHENAELLRLGVEALNRRDTEAFKALLAADAEIVPLRGAVDGTVYRGPDAADRFFAGLNESWERLDLEIDEAHEGEDWILAFGPFRARGAGSGVDVELHMGMVLRSRDGAVTLCRVYTDRAEALEAVGL
ncbi:MAG: hypothetical protein QOK31_1527 [Solirubrobacteraceae bacterium]|jgi:ketosteroid isomerase-like protein|nr:hypothetical protein [Solirubrobacteraceae bacterium]